MADSDGTLIRFTGVLREDMHFIHVPAWETATVFDRPPEGDGTFAVDLLDGGERVVSRASPAIDFREGSPPGGSGLRLANIVVYVPMHSEARVLVFRRLEPSVVEIFRTELAAEPPMIGDVALGRGRPRGTFRITWTVKHDRPTTSSVFLVRDAHPALLVATGLSEPAFNVDPRTLPGPTGRLAILATDGFRATTVIGPELDGLLTEIRVEITVHPAGTVAPDQPVSVTARAVDVAGVTVPVDGVTWTLDGMPAGEGAVIVTPPLEPGTHEVIANATIDGTALPPATAGIDVAKRNEAQEAYAKQMADLPPLNERMRDLEG